MEPLLEVRDYLASTQAPSVKKQVREFKRRIGQPMVKNMYVPDSKHTKEKIKFEDKDGEDLFSRGPYKLEICKKILRMVLEAQIKVRKNGPDQNAVLIHPEELHEIRRIWLTERGDWEDSVPKIYFDTSGKTLDWVRDDTGTFGSKELTLLHEVCAKYDVPQAFIQKLLDAELQTQGMNKRSSIFKRIDHILAEEWRDEEDVKKEVLQELLQKNAVSAKISQNLVSTLDQIPTTESGDI
jgi:DNA sulfur modification protein DndC